MIGFFTGLIGSLKEHFRPHSKRCSCSASQVVLVPFAGTLAGRRPHANWTCAALHGRYSTRSSNRRTAHFEAVNLAVACLFPSKRKVFPVADLRRMTGETEMRATPTIARKVIPVPCLRKLRGGLKIEFGQGICNLGLAPLTKIAQTMYIFYPRGFAPMFATRTGGAP